MYRQDAAPDGSSSAFVSLFRESRGKMLVKLVQRPASHTSALLSVAGLEGAPPPAAPPRRAHSRYPPGRRRACDG